MSNTYKINKLNYNNLLLNGGSCCNTTKVIYAHGISMGPQFVLRKGVEILSLTKVGDRIILTNNLDIHFQDFLNKNLKIYDETGTITRDGSLLLKTLQQIDSRITFRLQKSNDTINNNLILFDYTVNDGQYIWCKKTNKRQSLNIYGRNNINEFERKYTDSKTTNSNEKITILCKKEHVYVNNIKNNTKHSISSIDERSLLDKLIIDNELIISVNSESKSEYNNKKYKYIKVDDKKDRTILEYDDNDTTTRKSFSNKIIYIESMGTKKSLNDIITNKNYLYIFNSYLCINVNKINKENIVSTDRINLIYNDIKDFINDIDSKISFIKKQSNSISDIANSITLAMGDTPNKNTSRDIKESALRIESLAKKMRGSAENEKKDNYWVDVKYQEKKCNNDIVVLLDVEKIERIYLKDLIDYDNCNNTDGITTYICVICRSISKHATNATLMRQLSDDRSALECH